MRVALGVDPDTRTTGLALLRETEVLAVSVARGRGPCSQAQAMPGVLGDLAAGTLAHGALLVLPDLVAVEGQQVYRGRSNPNDILKLGQVAGAFRDLRPVSQSV